MSTINNVAPTNANKNAIWRRKWYPGLSNINITRRRAQKKYNVLGAETFARLQKSQRNILVTTLEETPEHLPMDLELLHLHHLTRNQKRALIDYLWSNRDIILSNKGYQGGKRTRRRKTKL